MCKSGKNQTGRERDPLPVCSHTSKKPSKVEKKLPYKCSTSSLPSKSCPSQRMEEKTGGEGTCRLSQPVRATGHDSPWLNWRCMDRLRTGYTCSKGRSGDISTETQHVNAGWQQRARLTCCNAHSSHTPAPWTTF